MYQENIIVYFSGSLCPSPSLPIIGQACTPSDVLDQGCPYLNLIHILGGFSVFLLALATFTWTSYIFLEVLSVVAVVSVTLTQLVRRPFDPESGNQCTPHSVPWMAVGMRVSSELMVSPPDISPNWLFTSGSQAMPPHQTTLAPTPTTSRRPRQSKLRVER